jgi:hypothetical protein
MGRRLAWSLCAALAALSAWTASAVPSSGGQPLDLATNGFGLHLRLALPSHWRLLPADPQGPPSNESVTLVHVGTPPADESQWWGPDIVIVNGARVHRQADAVSRKAATPDMSKFVAWPGDFFGYLTTLPGVRVVSGPGPVRIGGVRGTQITVQTPPMHPLIWLDGDTGWLGGGPSGVDPTLTRQIILLNVKGRKLLLAFADAPARFKTRWPQVRQLYSSIRF